MMKYFLITLFVWISTNTFVFAQDEKEQEIINKIDKYITNADTISISYYDSLLVEFPNSPYLIAMKTCNLVYQNRINDASIYIENKLNNDKFKDNSFILMALGILYQNTNKKDYLDYFLLSLKGKFSEENKWVYLHLYNYYKDEDKNKSNKYLSDALAIDPEFTQALIIKSYSLNQIDNCKEIIDNLEIVSKNYQNYEVASYLGNAYFNCFNREKAEFFFNKSNEITINSDAYLGLAHIKEFEDKDKVEALKLYKKSLELNEKNTTALLDIAWLYYSLGNDDDSEKNLKKYLEINKTQEYFNEIISFFLISNDVLKAKKYNDQSRKINKLNSYNEGFKIIIEIINHKGEWNDSLSKDIRNYESKYDNTQSTWLKETISSISIK